MLTVAFAALAFSLPDRPPSDALLRVRLANFDRDATEDWLRRRPFAVVLPIQPMLLKPLETPLCGLELTFRRKPNSEKGGQDGGLRFALSSDEEKAAAIARGQRRQGKAGRASGQGFANAAGLRGGSPSSSFATQQLDLRRELINCPIRGREPPGGR